MPIMMLTLYVHAQTAQLAMTDLIHGHLADRFVDRRRRPDSESGQATTEYALVLLAAAMVALLVVAWASAGGGAAKISRLFNRVIDAVVDRV